MSPSGDRHTGLSRMQRRHTDTPRRLEKGFTLVEVLVAIVMLTIIILGGMQFFVAGSARVDRGVHQRAAFEMAYARLEALSSAPYDSIASLTENSVSLDDIVCTRVTKVTYVDDPLDGTGAGDSDAQDYKQITVSVYWTEAGRTQSVDMATLVTP